MRSQTFISGPTITRSKLSLNSGFWQKIHCSNCSSPFCISYELLIGLILFITVVHLDCWKLFRFFSPYILYCVVGQGIKMYILPLFVNIRVWTCSGLYYFLSLPSEQYSSDNKFLIGLISTIFNNRYSCFSRKPFLV